MDSEVSLLLERAENELLIARTLKKLSEDESNAASLEIPSGSTFYSSVIAHSYYAIFYSAKAYLASKKMAIPAEQGQHQQVYYKFSKLVKEGAVDIELFRIYEDIKIKAEFLLGIFNDEKKKRTDFTYRTIPQANKQPAEESLNNSLLFVSNIRKMAQEV